MAKKITKPVKTTKPTKKVKVIEPHPTPVVSAAKTCIDREKRTCIEISRIDGVVHYVPLSAEDGFQLFETSEISFDSRYKEHKGYPAEKAAQLYASYARELGASSEAMAALATLTIITPQELAMATNKLKTNAAAAADKATKKATPKEKTSKAATKAEKVAAQKKVVKADDSPKVKKPSAASMFQELILAGNLTDDKIFQKVQAKFNLDDSKRGYVTWYRNHLRKNGQNPPDAK